MAPDDSAASDGVTAGESTAPGHDDIDIEGDDDHDPARSRRRRLVTGAVVLVLALVGLTGWLGYRAYETQQAEKQRAVYLDVGRQAAQNLTTIDWQQAEADVQRVLDVATGTFYDDFQRRAQPFIEVVKEAQSKSVGTLGESGVESVSDNGARVLVAVTVQSSNAGAPDQAPKAWRMRLTLQRVDDGAKVSNVEFVQ
ncbi:tetratricopeptide repeat protein [Mycolicibacterium sp. S2-37]|uniref:tetratricopeptide repeat protein n=1 Tax=Mycolicibacterium sp. S2-37 TaxID=2810297 RepID=UPI001F5F13C3|nr:tetratricopeptide repeat protein [Mycolicibacterium sp. S2-37]